MVDEAIASLPRGNATVQSASRRAGTNSSSSACLTSVQESPTPLPPPAMGRIYHDQTSSDAALAVGRQQHYAMGMDTAPLPGESALTQNFAQAAEEQHHLSHEADAVSADAADRRRQRTLRALADVDAGRLIDDEAMQAWADSLGTDHELPVPQPG